MRLQTPAPAPFGLPLVNGNSQNGAKYAKGVATLNELDPRIKLRSSLRCDGIGRLDCAEDLESGQRLAVRWLPLEANGEAAVKACERLPHHPMLPRIRQTGKMGSMAFLALDFPEGSLLSTILGDRLDTGVVLQMASQLADALATVHGQGVVHGEFGSDSVLMVGDKSYLWDLPLVIANRLTDRRGENRLMQNLVRIVPYLAPERARGAGASREADVYSLGALLCICAGAPMPVDSTTLGTVYSIAQGQWVPRVPATIPQPYYRMIERMISADAAERPEAQEVAALFAKPMHSGSLPTVPDMPMIRLPPELQERANALLKSPPQAPVEHDVVEAVQTPVGVAAVEAVTATTPVEMVEVAPAPVPAVDAVEVAAVAVESAVVDSPSVAQVTAAVVDVVTVTEAPAPVEAAPELLAAPPAVAEGDVAVAAALAPTVETAKVETAKVETVVAPPAPPEEVPEAAAADVLKLPTIEVPKVLVVESTPVMPPPSAPSTSVRLSHNVAVAPDLMPSGGVFGLYNEPPKASMKMWYLAGGLVVLVVSLLVLGINLLSGSSESHEAKAPAAVPAKEAEKSAAPVAAPEAKTDAPAAPAPVDEKAAAPAVPAVPAPAAAAPAVSPVEPAHPESSTKLAPAKPSKDEMVDMGGTDDDLSPLAHSKAAVRAPQAPAPVSAAAAAAAAKVRRTKAGRVVPVIPSIMTPAPTLSLPSTTAAPLAPSAATVSPSIAAPVAIEAPVAKVAAPAPAVPVSVSKYEQIFDEPNSPEPAPATPAPTRADKKSPTP